MLQLSSTNLKDGVEVDAMSQLHLIALKLLARQVASPQVDSILKL